jgi:hypothetical protein
MLHFDEMIMMGIIMHQITLTSMPLPLFKTMAQSRRGVPHILEAQVYPLVSWGATDSTSCAVNT